LEAKQVSAQVREALKKKVDEHNEKFGDNPAKRVTLGMLTAVFRRGVGAYNTNPQSVRPSVNSADQWAYARVNTWLRAVRTGKFSGGKFDTDLLPSGHPLSTRDKGAKGLYDDLNFTIPKGAKEEAKRGLEWVKEFGRGGTSVGRNSARYILNNTTAGAEKVRHIAKYFPRHEVDKRAEGWRQGEKGYPSNGRIAWALWGGEAGKSWSQKLVRAMDKRDEKANSAFELIARRNKLREENWEYRLNRFRNEKTKDILWKEHDKLLTQWEKVIQNLFFDLLQKQDRRILAMLNQYGVQQIGVNGLIEFSIEENTKSWSADVYDYFLSLVNDFAFYQVDLLLPVRKSAPLVIPTYQKESKKEIIEQGFFYRLVSVQQLPLTNLRQDPIVREYVADLIDDLLPELSKTSKKRFDASFRKSLEEALEMGLSGRSLQNHVAKSVKKILSQKNLTRALTIARTEANKLANYGRLVGAKSTQIVYTKEWISQRDGKVRDAHVTLDGTEVPEEQQFSYGGYLLDYPSDSSLGAPPELTVNCRCFLNYHEKRI
jgi:hypothetical protein